MKFMTFMASSGKLMSARINDSAWVFDLNDKTGVAVNFKEGVIYVS